MDGRPMTIEQALALHQTGDLTQARDAYRQILANNPEQPDALHLSGVIAYQQGQAREAIDLITQALRCRPEQAAFYNNLGAAQQALGELEHAEQSFQHALRIQPGYVDARFNLGVLHQQQDRLDAAVTDFTAVIRSAPQHLQAYLRLGGILHQQGQTRPAIDCFDRAAAIDSADDNAAFQLAVHYREAGCFDRAVDRLRRLCWRNAEHVGARFELATILQTLGRFGEAISYYHEVLEREPGHVQSYHNLGVAHTSLMQLNLAEDCFHRALELNPRHPAAHNGLGSLLREQGRLTAAAECFQKSIELAPFAAEPRTNLAGVLQVQGRPQEAVAAYRQAVDLDPNSRRIHSNLLMAMHYDSASTPDEIYREHQRWADRHAAVEPGLHSFANVRDPRRRLRIGYLSADFRAHSVAYFVEPLLARHNRDVVEVTCYADVAAPDDVTRRLEQYPEHWKNIYGKTDHDLLRIIRDDEIDILVDLAGHTGGNRLTVLARRAAPIQATHLGYGSTTGLSTVDYRLTDEIADPPTETRRHSEELFYLPSGIFCYSPPANCPPVGPLPCSALGHVTFGSFNNAAKIGPAVIDVWAELLHAVPESRLMMKNYSLTDEATAEQYRNRFAERGISADRLDLCGQSPSLREHFDHYGRIDIALDSFPYAGVTTTCESLWMGVPVVTLRGDHYVGRCSASLLSRIGCDELIAESTGDYLRIACELAANPERLAAARRSLRQTMAASPVCDAATAARELEECYRQMWQRWCLGIRKAG